MGPGSAPHHTGRCGAWHRARIRATRWHRRGVLRRVRDPRLCLPEHLLLPDGQISAQFSECRFTRLPPMAAKSPALKFEFHKPFQPDLPCPVLRAKTFCFSSSSNRWFVAPSRPRQEGRIAIVTTREAGCGGRVGACDERGLCGRRSRVVLAPLGWRQVGGDALHRADDGD